MFITYAEPSTTKTLPEDYVKRVKNVHESGGYGSRGYVSLAVYSVLMYSFC